MPELNVFIAVPALDENNYLPLLLEDIRNQSYAGIKLFICVNNPEEWRNDKSKSEFLRSNERTIEYLSEINDIDLTVIDKSSPGKGWQGKKRGVGMARKLLFDTISENAKDDDIVISLDADTRISENYVRSVAASFKKEKKALLLANPYYHELSGEEKSDRAILRYELYMRYYLLNLFRIGSPYAFTALGSAIAFRPAAYRKINGITPREAGEDFYFVNRMKKAGKVLVWNREVVKPSSRASERVPFGTGPAVSKGMAGDWSAYPFYSMLSFDRIRKTYALLPKLFRKNIETPIDEFIETSFGKNIWEPLRKNFKTEQSFIRACHEKIDGLRILQILRSYNSGTDKNNFTGFCRSYGIKLPQDFSFETSGITQLESLRQRLFDLEMENRKSIRLI